MNPPPGSPKFLFIINPGSGNKNTDWSKEITDFYSSKNIPVELYELPKDCKKDAIRKLIKELKADKVVAVGGDGTVKLVAECLLGTDTAMGILPGGSANGMARELGIPDNPAEAMEIVLNGQIKEIHLLKVNKELCIHLSDIGFNAFVVKKFEDDSTRGMWGYMKAAWKVLMQNRYMLVKLETDKEEVIRNAAMVVIANATTYGNGVVINPKGSLYDDLFEVIVIRKISFREIFKMRFTQKKFNPKKTEFFQTRSLYIQSKHHAHFQVDGETKGKVREIQADILKERLKVIMAAEVAGV
jgi:YegS/Rv2252/BmrU family lipid kinase